MKKVTFLLIFLLSILLSDRLYSQDLIFPEIESLLTLEQKAQLDKVNKLLQKATGNENNANAIDSKYAKLERKSNKTDWEKKTWEAKQQRIIAERNYQNGYRMIFDLYSEIISDASYVASADETKALLLNKDAHKKFKEANAKLAQYSDISKEQLELTNYEDLRNNLAKSHNLKVAGIRDQISGLEIFINKGVNVEKDKEDNLAWEKAQKDNTIASYYKYLDSHPRGKHMFKASSNIRELEKNPVNQKNVAYTRRHNYKNTKKNENNNVIKKDNENNKKEVNDNKNINVDQGLIFKVQIAASKVDLSDWFISTKAPNAKKIETVYIDDWIKYMVGEFNSYHDAAKYRNMLQSTAPDAFIVVFKNGNQIQITNAMKK